MQEFNGRVAVITGAASGIGLALAERCSSEGMKLVLADIDGPQLNVAVARLMSRGIEVVNCIIDVSNENDVAKLADLAFDRFGAVHLLCNNAGVFPANPERPVWDCTADDWRWVFDVNVMGVAHGVRSFVPRMIAAGTEGHVVNTASIAGLIGGSEAPAYGSTKAAVVRISEALFTSLEDIDSPIGVSVLCPGAVESRIHQSERLRPLRRDDNHGDMPAPEIAAEPRLANGSRLHADVVADLTFEAIKEKRFYIFTTDIFNAAIQERTRAMLAGARPRFPKLSEIARKAGEI